MANLKNITELPVAESADGLNLIVEDNGSAKRIAASAVGAQADFAVTDETSPAFIKNKPKVVQADWAVKDETNPAYLKNKPFYDTREYGNITLTFDGDITGKEVVQFNATTNFVKLYENIPTKEELIGATVSLVEGGETITIEVTSDMIQDDGNGNLIIADAYVVVPDSFTFNGGPTLSRGVWGACAVENGVTVLYAKELSWYGVVSGELKKIEEKYLPEEELDLDIVITQVQDAEGNNADPTWVINSINTFENIKNKIFNGIHPNCKCQVKMCIPTEDTVVRIESYNSMNTFWRIEGEEEVIIFGIVGFDFEPFVVLTSDNTIVNVGIN